MKNLEELFRQVAVAQDGLSETTHRRALVRRRLESMGSQDRGLHRPAPWKAVTWATLGAAAAAAVAGFWLERQNEPITAKLGSSGASVSPGAWLDAPDASSLPLRFSDGTRVEVAPHAHMRVLELGRQGAKLALESGRAGIDVAHGENRRWELRAGPFSVHVTGTRFDMSWQPTDDRFELVLSEGQVEITGCGFGEGRSLVAGQTVRASCRNGAVDIAYSPTNPVASGAASQATTAPLTLASDAPSAVPSAESTSVGAKTRVWSTPGPVDWRKLAGEGKYVDALEAAERLGFDAECARGDAAVLAQLGEVALRARDLQKARQAWLQLRRRFGGTSQAALAAFSLGVLEFDQRHANARAADWFRTYIRESPKGPLSREARGRLIEALQSTGGDEVRNLAKDYLRDYPSGPHAKLAERLVPSP